MSVILVIQIIFKILLIILTGVGLYAIWLKDGMPRPEDECVYNFQKTMRAAMMLFLLLALGGFFSF